MRTGVFFAGMQDREESLWLETYGSYYRCHGYYWYYTPQSHMYLTGCRGFPKLDSCSCHDIAVACTTKMAIEVKLQGVMTEN